MLSAHAMPWAFLFAGLLVELCPAFVGDPDLIREIDKVSVPYSVDVLSQAVGVALLERPDVMERRVAAVRREREALRARIATIDGLEPLEPSSSFFLVRVATELGTPTEVVEALKSRDVVLRDVSTMPLLEDCFRITVGTPEDSEAILEGLRSL